MLPDYRGGGRAYITRSTIFLKYILRIGLFTCSMPRPISIFILGFIFGFSDLNIFL